MKKSDELKIKNMYENIQTRGYYFHSTDLKKFLYFKKTNFPKILAALIALGETLEDDFFYEELLTDLIDLENGKKDYIQILKRAVNYFTKETAMNYVGTEYEKEVRKAIKKHKSKIIKKSIKLYNRLLRDDIKIINKEEQ